MKKVKKHYSKTEGLVIRLLGKKQKAESSLLRMIHYVDETCLNLSLSWFKVFLLKTKQLAMRFRVWYLKMLVWFFEKFLPKNKNHED